MKKIKDQEVSLHLLQQYKYTVARFLEEIKFFFLENNDLNIGT